MKKRALTILQYVFFLALGLFLVWWTIKDLTNNDRSQIKLSLRHARYLLIIPVFAILILSHYIRGLRWCLLIEPLGYKAKKRNAFFAVMIGYLTNLAFPRLGEVIKCTALSRYEKIPTDKLIGTIILERIVDVLSLLVIFGITLVIQPGIYSQLVETFFHSTSTDETKKTSAFLIILIIVSIIVIAVAAWMIIKKKKPADLVILIKKIIHSVWEGISTIQHLKKRAYFIFLTVALWTVYLFCGYLGFYALEETQQYGIREAFTVLSAGSIGMIIPTPGGIGSYAYLVQRTMMLYGLNEGIALAFGWILWISQTSVLLLGGLFSFAALPYFNKKKIEKADIIPQKIFLLPEMIRQISRWRFLGKKIVFTNGVFDIIHPGHIFSLSEAAKEANLLIVGLNSDASVKRLKGESRPLNNQDARALQLAALLMVDAVVIFEEDTPLELIKSILPDVLVKGGDYSIDQIAGAKEVLANGGRVVINKILEGFSTTSLINKMKEK